MLTTDAHSGKYAMSIWNWYYYVKATFLYGDKGDPYFRSMPLGDSPQSLTGWYKYIYGDNQGAADSAVCEILLYNRKRGDATMDTIAFTTAYLGPADKYHPFEIPISYRRGRMKADSISIVFSSSAHGYCSGTSSGECLYLTVDDLALRSFPVSNETLALELAPSAKKSCLEIHSKAPLSYPVQLKVFNAQGDQVFAKTLTSTKTKPFKHSLPAGTYGWLIKPADGGQHKGFLNLP